MSHQTDEVQAGYNTMFSGHFEALRDKLGRAMLADRHITHHLQIYIGPICVKYDLSW